MSERMLRIGEVAARTGVSVPALRFYERRGLIAPARRLPSGYRAFTPAAVREVRLVKWGQGLGFTLEELVEVMRILRDHQRKHSGGVRARALAKIEARRAALARGRALRRSLQAIADCRCQGDCPIIERAVADRRRR